MLLEVVTLARNVGADLEAVRQADARDLAQRGVRLTGRGGRDARADTAALRSAGERGRLDLRLLLGAALANKLIDGRHGERSSSFRSYGDNKGTAGAGGLRRREGRVPNLERKRQTATPASFQAERKGSGPTSSR